MTPPSASAQARSTGHARTSTRRGVAPRGPRRVSGPARGVRTSIPSSGAVALPTPLIQRLGQISESRSLDRLLRSRGWIALLGVLLIGLVFMQVSLLKVNAGMGADVEKAAALERGNALLQADVSKLESNDRIQGLAMRAGMILPTSDNVRYLGANGKRIGGAEAAANMPSQGEASTAVLPTIPQDTAVEGATGTTGVADTTVTTGSTSTTAEPQTTSSVPNAALAQQQAADAAAQQQAQTQTQTPAATPTTTDTTASTGATAPPPADATTAAATGAATVGGATPGG